MFRREIPKNCLSYLFCTTLVILLICMLCVMFPMYDMLVKLVMNQSYMIGQQTKQTNSIEDHHQISFSRERILSDLIKSDNKPKPCLLKKDNRIFAKFDCYPENGASETNCQDRGCVWQALDDQVPLNVPYCYYPENWQIYHLTRTTVTDEFLGTLELIGKSPYKNAVQTLEMRTESIDNNILRVKVRLKNYFIKKCTILWRH